MQYRYLLIISFLFASKSHSHESFIDFKVDQSKHRIELRLLDENGKPLGSFKRLKNELDGKGQDLIFSMNAGIYMQNQMPLGLYIENSKTYRKLNTKKNLYGNFYLNPNGVFLISNGKAHILESDLFNKFSRDHPIEYATQSGPLLLINGKYNKSLSKYDKNKVIRNAICINSRNEVTFSISKKSVSFSEMSRHLSEDLMCKSALYLDGSISGAYKDQITTSNFNLYGPLFLVRSL